MAGEYTLERLAVPDSLDTLQDLLARAGREHPEVPAADLMMLETAVVEIAGNVIEHGRPEGEVVWSFRLEVGDQELQAWLSDTGQPLPRDVTSAALPAEWTDENGRGLALARATLDRLDYSRLPDGGGNLWRMVRRRADA